jgi:hypothetical protein
MERLTGLALSRIACFEATARQKDKYSAANLEKQWQITSNKWAETAHTEKQSTLDDCPAASHSHVGMNGAASTSASTSTSTSTCCVSDCVKESRPAKKSLSSVRGSGGDLASLMEARRKAQEENADDGYYF